MDHIRRETFDLLMALTTGKVKWKYTCLVFGVLLVITTEVEVLALLKLFADNLAIPHLVSAFFSNYFNKNGGIKNYMRN